MGTMLKNIANALSITATGAQAAILNNVSPFLGGQGRNAILNVQAAPAGGGVIQILGNDTGGDETAPANDDPNWTVRYTINAASPLQQEIQLPLWLQVNVSTVGTGTFTADLQGIQ